VKGAELGLRVATVSSRLVPVLQDSREEALPGMVVVVVVSVDHYPAMNSTLVAFVLIFVVDAMDPSPGPLVYHLRVIPS
jgi:hypothetical protein